MEQVEKFKALAVKGGIIIFLAHTVCFLLGYFRDILIVRNLGASASTDAWYIASNIPEYLFRFLLLGTLGATFMPVFVEYISKKQERDRKSP